MSGASWTIMVIADTSTVSNLAIIGRIDALRLQFGEVICPSAVRDELQRLQHSSAKEAIDQGFAAGWLRVMPCAPSPFLTLLRQTLGPGESEAIALAVSTRAPLVLVDETDGRVLRPGGTLEIRACHALSAGDPPGRRPSNIPAQGNALGIWKKEGEP